MPLFKWADYLMTSRGLEHLEICDPAPSNQPADAGGLLDELESKTWAKVWTELAIKTTGWRDSVPMESPWGRRGH